MKFRWIDEDSAAIDVDAIWIPSHNILQAVTCSYDEQEQSEQSRYNTEKMHGKN